MISKHHWLSQLVRLFQPRPRTIRTRCGLPRQAALRLEGMEDRCTPATLTLTTGVLAYTAGSENNDFTITVSGANYVINDVVGISAIPTGWTGVGTETVTGPTAGVSSISVNLGGGSDVANIRSIAADITVTSTGSLTTNLSSNAPTNSGTLAGIDGNVTVTGSGSGTNAIVVSNSLAATGSTSTITATQVTGMLPSAKTLTSSNIGSLRVIGSNLGVNNFTVDVTTGSTALEVDTLGGNDTVAVQATSGATTVKSTSGSDTVTVGTTGNGSVGLDNINGALLIDEGTGTAKVLTVTDATSTAADPNVQITSSTITGLAPAIITYRATGGSFGGVGVTIDGSNTAATAFTLNGTLTSSNMTVNGDGGNDSFTVAASSKANLNGGSGNVTFNLGGNGVVLTGSIVGGAGTNTLTYASRAVAVSVNMTGAAAGTATGISGTFSGITALVGSSGSDTLTGTNATTAWVVSGANSGSITGGPSFWSFENLTGGSGADSFAFTGGSVSGSIIGSGGSNTLNYSGISVTVGVTMTGAAAGTATDLGTFANIATLVGDGATSTLTGSNATTAWVITGPNTGTITSGPAFSAFDNLTSGTGTNTYSYSGAGNTTGTVTGGGGTTNSLQFSSISGGVTVNLASMAVTQTTGGAAVVAAFTGMNDFQGAAVAGDTLIGPNATTAWGISGIGAGTVGADTFRQFANLTGGSGADTFAFTGGSISGSINGAAGTNVLSYSGASGTVGVMMTGAAAGTATSIGGTFANIATLVGNGITSTLTGPNTTTAWVITGPNTGTITSGPAFSAFANLTGGSGYNTFAFSGGSVTGSIIGGSGSNTLDYSGISVTVGVTMTGAAAGTATDIGGTFTNIATLVGDGATSTLTGPNTTTAWGITGTNTGTITGGPAFSVFANLAGGSGADDFAFIGGSVSGSINGGAGANTIDYSAAAGPTAIALTGMGSSVGFAGTGPLISAFTNITTIIAAGGTSNSLIGQNATATWTVDEAGGNLTYVSGGQTLAFSNFQLLTGGSVADTFNIVSTNAGSLWTLNGGAGANVFNMSNLANQNAVITLLGGAGTNTLNVTDAGDTSLAEWSVSVGNIALNALNLDYSGIANVSITTGSGQVYVDLEGSAAGGMLTLNLAGSSNELDVGLNSNLYGLAGNVQVNLTNGSSSNNVLTVNDTDNAVNEAWTVSDSLITQSGSEGALAISGAAQFGSMVVLAGNGGSTGNTFAVTASAASVISVDGGMGTNNSLTVHEGSATGTDNGNGQITFANPTLQPVNYSDFDYAPVIVS